MRKKKIKVPIYPFRFRIIEFETDEQIQKVFDNTLINVKTSNAFVYEYKEKFYICFTRCVKKDVNYPTSGIIVHESKHLVNQIFAYIGMGLNVHNDEAETYLLQWIFEKISKFFDK